MLHVQTPMYSRAYWRIDASLSMTLTLPDNIYILTSKTRSPFSVSLRQPIARLCCTGQCVIFAKKRAASMRHAPRDVVTVYNWRKHWRITHMGTEPKNQCKDPKDRLLSCSRLYHNSTHDSRSIFRKSYENFTLSCASCIIVRVSLLSEDFSCIAFTVTNKVEMRLRGVWSLFSCRQWSAINWGTRPKISRESGFNGDVSLKLVLRTTHLSQILVQILWYCGEAIARFMI